MPAGPSPRDPRAAATRARIASCALDLFQDRGYDAVTTEDIARAAGINPRTYFRHFPTKASVVFFTSEDAMDDLVRSLHRCDPRVSLIDALIEAILAQGASQIPQPDDVARFELVRSTPSLLEEMRNRHARYEAHLAEWIARRVGRDTADVDVRVVAACLIAIRRVVMEDAIRTGADLAEAERLLRRALGMLHPPFD